MKPFVTQPRLPICASTNATKNGGPSGESDD